MGEVAMGEVKRYETESIDRLFLELSQFTTATTGKELALEAERDALKDEVAKLTDKALRYDLDQLGISQREREAVELVDLRAEVAKLRAACGQMREALDRCADWFGRPSPHFDDKDSLPYAIHAALATDAGKGWIDATGAVEDQVYEATNSQIIGDTVHTFSTLHVRLPCDWAGKTVLIMVKPGG